MKERLVAMGGLAAGFSIATSNCTPESEYIKGTVVDMRQEVWETRIEERIQTLPNCPDGHRGPQTDCPTGVFHMEVEVIDAPDRILTLENVRGERFEVFVWPRVQREAILNAPIKIDPRYGSVEKDLNNQEKIISKTLVE